MPRCTASQNFGKAAPQADASAADSRGHSAERPSTGGTGERRLRQSAHLARTHTECWRRDRASHHRHKRRTNPPEQSLHHESRLPDCTGFPQPADGRQPTPSLVCWPSATPWRSTSPTSSWTGQWPSKPARSGRRLRLGRRSPLALSFSEPLSSSPTARPLNFAVPTVSVVHLIFLCLPLPVLLLIAVVSAQRAGARRVLTAQVDAQRPLPATFSLPWESMSTIFSQAGAGGPVGALVGTLPA